MDVTLDQGSDTYRENDFGLQIEALSVIHDLIADVHENILDLAIVSGQGRAANLPYIAVAQIIERNVLSVGSSMENGREEVIVGAFAPISHLDEFAKHGNGSDSRCIIVPELLLPAN